MKDEKLKKVANQISSEIKKVLKSSGLPDVHTSIKFGKSGFTVKATGKTRENVYHHAVDLSKLIIKNSPKEKFRELLENIAYRGYEVEQIHGGRKIIITKPGGKFGYGTVKREDFMVWIYDENTSSLWLISHKNIYEDLEEKGGMNPIETIKIIDALGRVYNGEDPDDVLRMWNWKIHAGNIQMFC